MSAKILLKTGLATGARWDRTGPRPAEFRIPGVMESPLPPCTTRFNVSVLGGRGEEKKSYHLNRISFAKTWEFCLLCTVTFVTVHFWEESGSVLYTLPIRQLKTATRCPLALSSPGQRNSAVSASRCPPPAPAPVTAWWLSSLPGCFHFTSTSYVGRAQNWTQQSLSLISPFQNLKQINWHNCRKL